MKLAVAVLLGLALAGCASAQYLESKDPVETREFAGAPLPLGECATNRIKQAFSGEDFPILRQLGPSEFLEDRFDGKVFRLLAQQASYLGPNGNHNWSLEFVAASAATTRVELRSISTVWGTPQAPTDELWGLVLDCSARMSAGAHA